MYAQIHSYYVIDQTFIVITLFATLFFDFVIFQFSLSLSFFLIFTNITFQNRKAYSNSIERRSYPRQYSREISMLATARNLSSFNKYKLQRHWLCNRFASMHPASDVRYFVIMSRAMFIAILNGRRGGGRDLARISRDTRLLRCIRFVILVEKNITVFFLALFFFFFFSSVMWASFHEPLPEASGNSLPPRGSY